MIYLNFALLLVILYVLFWQASLLIAVMTGVPIVYANKSAIIDALRLAGVKKGDLIVDLGCGDGRSLILAAKHFGAHGIGVDRATHSYLYSKINVFLSGQKGIRIIKGDFSAAENELKKADFVYVYLLENCLDRIEPWLFDNLKPSAKIISMAFRFKDRKPIAETKTKLLRMIASVRIYSK